MKKEILKVCVLGLVAATVFTGCQKKENEVKNIEKREELAYNVSDKVVKVDIDQEDIDKEHFKMFVNATNNEEKTVWKFDIGTFGVGMDFYSLTAHKGDKYFYYGVGNKLEARDIQTGKIVWKSELKSELAASTLVEQEGKVYVESGMAAGYTVEILDIENGKSLFYAENIDSVMREPDGNMQYDFEPQTMKIEGNIVIFEVNLNDAGGNYVKKAGYLKVNTENNKVNFERI